MLTALTLSLAIINPTCTATAESRDLQVATNKAMQEVSKIGGCSMTLGDTKIESYELLGRTVYRVTVTAKEAK